MVGVDTVYIREFLLPLYRVGRMPASIVDVGSRFIREVGSREPRTTGDNFVL